MEKTLLCSSTELKHIKANATMEELINLRATLLDLVEKMPEMAEKVKPMLDEIVKPLRERKIENVKEV